jgi:GTP-binding protein
VKKPKVTFAGSAASPDQFPRDGLPEVAFLGRSNVGKSCLLNALAGTRGLARVSAQPGRTRVVNFFRVDDDLYLADLPGYGYAAVPEKLRRSWERLARSYLEGREALALCVFLVDVRHDPMPGDELLQRYLDELGLAYVLAATKSDKLGRGRLIQRRQALARAFGRATPAIVPVSGVTGLGTRELWGAIRQAAQDRSETFSNGSRSTGKARSPGATFAGPEPVSTRERREHDGS